LKKHLTNTKIRGIIYYRKGVRTLENIAKALKDLQKALDNNPNVKTVKITITLQKPSKPNKN
jgi:hypothetical protein